MASLSDDQWAAVSSWIGNEPRELFTGRYTRLGDLDAAVHESLRAQLNSLIYGNALSFTVEDISMNYSENVKAMERRIAEFGASGGLSGSGTGATRISRIKRPQYR